MLGQLRRLIRRTQSKQKLDLSYLFDRVAVDGSLKERIDWTASLVEWIRSTSLRSKVSAATRIRFILQWLDRHPEGRERGARVVRSILRDTRKIRLYSEVGLPAQPTFGREFRRRLLHVVIPSYADPESLAGAQARIFYEDHDHLWIENLPADVLGEVVKWLRTGLAADEELVPGWRGQILDACRILAARALSIAWREDVSRRAPDFPIEEHPLAKLVDELGVLRATMKREALRSGHFAAVRVCLVDGRKLIQSVRAHVEQFGVSVDLVYQLDRMRNDLLRIHKLLDVLEAEGGGEPVVPAVRGLWVELLRGYEKDGDFAFVLRKHLGLLSRKIVERTGSSGEHYITQNRHEYFHMLIMAGGGGALTALTAFLKYLPSTGSWPIFFEWLYFSLNYSVSFLIMHVFDLKLATKQPSMTAAALAGKLKEDGNTADDEAFVDEIARIARSQFAAVTGNILLVIPFSLGIGWLYQSFYGRAFMSEDTAHHMLASIDPVFSGTLLFASLTGVLLWLSSMTAGWVENASVFHRVPDVIRTHPLAVLTLGEKRAAQMAEVYQRNVSGVVGSVALGFLLATAPLVSRFFGVPLAAHHVTLSSGAASYSYLALGWEHTGPGMLAWTALGILIIGTLNFGVSFVLALAVAVRARDLSRTRLRQVFREAGRRLLKKPGQFFLPPKN